MRIIGFGSFTMLRFLVVMALLGMVTPAADAACQEIKFKKGASSGDVQGRAPLDGQICYTIGTATGQKAQIRILKGDNTMFGIDGLVDGQFDYSFVTTRNRYTIRVTQSLRSHATQELEPFVMRVSIN